MSVLEHPGELNKSNYNIGRRTGEHSWVRILFFILFMFGLVCLFVFLFWKHLGLSSLGGELILVSSCFCLCPNNWNSIVSLAAGTNFWVWDWLSGELGMLGGTSYIGSYTFSFLVLIYTYRTFLLLKTNVCLYRHSLNEAMNLHITLQKILRRNFLCFLSSDCLKQLTNQPTGL